MLNGKSTIPAEIRDLIPYPESQISDNRLADNINAEKFTDILLGIGDLRIISSDVALEELGTIEAIDDLELKGMAMAGMGAMQTYIGNYFKAFGSFHRAFEVVTNPEVLVCVLSSILLAVVRFYFWLTYVNPLVLKFDEYGTLKGVK